MRRVISKDFVSEAVRAYTEMQMVHLTEVYCRSNCRYDGVHLTGSSLAPLAIFDQNSVDLDVTEVGDNYFWIIWGRTETCEMCSFVNYTHLYMKYKSKLSGMVKCCFCLRPFGNHYTVKRGYAKLKQISNILFTK